MLVVPEILPKSNLKKNPLNSQVNWLISYIIGMYVYGGWHVWHYVFESLLSPYTMVVLDMELESLGLVACAFTHGAISLPWHWHFITNKYVRSKNKESM